MQKEEQHRIKRHNGKSQQIGIMLVYLPKLARQLEGVIQEDITQHFGDKYSKNDAAHSHKGRERKRTALAEVKAYQHRKGAYTEECYQDLSHDTRRCLFVGSFCANKDRYRTLLREQG